MSPTIEQKHLFPLSLVSSLISVMGCNQSKIENEEAVSRCKDRKQFMKSSVSARNAFAAAHPSYAISLKNAGAALSDYAQGEVLPTLSSAAAAVSVAAAVALPTQPPIGNLPPPPPVPDFNPPPLQRAASMPELPVSSKTITRADTIVEEQGEVEGEDEAEESEVGLRRWRSNKRGGGGDDAPPRPPSPPETPPSVTRVPPPPPEMNSTYDFFFNPEIPGGSLRDAEEISMEREEIERKVLEKRPKRSEDHVGGGGKHEEKVAVPENVVEELPPPPVQPPQGGVGAGGGKIVKKGKQVVGGGSGGSEGKRRNVSLVQVFNELDDCFLKASQSAHEVSKMLEAARLHYHSNFADNRGHIDHSARVMRVITWNRSFRGLQNAEEVKDDFDKEESETHATVLDKLLAWEKKLYDEVKAGEIMKFEYQRKVALLNKQKKRGTNSESLEKTKAAVSHLHTRYIVDMQSMDSTVSEINRLRDEQLYPKLVALVDAMARMWDAMQVHHEKQLRISTLLKDVDISQSASETTDYHHERTNQLVLVVQGWHAHFHNMVSHQKDYTRTLNSWLKLNLIPIESTLKEKVSSPPRPQTPPIQHLLLAWHDSLEKLPDEHAKSAIYNFEAVLTSIYQLQQEEMKLKAKLEESRREHQRKQRSFTDWYRKYREQQITGSGENDPEFGRDEDGLYRDEAVVEREFVVETAKRKVEEDEENYQRHCIHVREKSLVSLKTRLPELFGAISKFAMASSEMYRSLSAVALSQDQKQKESSS